MNRREVLRLLGGVAVLPMLGPVSPEELDYAVRQMRSHEL
jgi:hypothetical protein